VMVVVWNARNVHEASKRMRSLIMVGLDIIIYERKRKNKYATWYSTLVRVQRVPTQ
jgi:hypothetical protein